MGITGSVSTGENREKNGMRWCLSGRDGLGVCKVMRAVVRMRRGHEKLWVLVSCEAAGR